MTNETHGTRFYPAYVGGTWVQGNGERMPVLNPADIDVVVGEVPALDAETVTSGYAAARAGALAWRNTSPLARAGVLFAAASLLRERCEELAALICAENGKTLAEARGEATKSAEFFEFYAGLARLPAGEILNDARPNTTVTVRHEPVGVVLAITPWNDPLLTPARKLAPALAAGNAVVLKPASETPLIALELARALLDAGLPPTVITVVTGRGRDISAALVDNPEVDAVTFTGSTDVGLELQRRVAGRNLRLQTEMGGKNAAIVLDDADLELASQTIAAAAFGQGGQRCTATSRVLVESGVREEFVRRLAEAAASVIIGRPEADGTTLGPLVSASQQNEVLSRVRDATGSGATVKAGGGQPVEPSLLRGCYVEPTVLENVSADMPIWTDEVFGPVVAIIEVPDLVTAIELTNASRYGLSASIFTRSLESSATFLDRVETGQAAVNLPTSGWDVHHPFGGYKLSGSPFKEQGLEALHFYTRVKTCAVRSR